MPGQPECYQFFTGSPGVNTLFDRFSRLVMQNCDSGHTERTTASKMLDSGAMKPQAHEVVLACPTDPRWTTAVLSDFDRFLLDHAACERKASATAVSLVCHYPDRRRLVAAMTDLAIEELAHFREVMKHVLVRGLKFERDEKDPYINGLAAASRRGTEAWLLDRLLVAAIVEARGCERFALIGQALQDAALADFYCRIAASEARHAALFVELASHYAPAADVSARLAELITIEAKLLSRLPLRAALH